jgi:hypothetical protein
MSHPPLRLGATFITALALTVGACSDGSGPSGTTSNTLTSIQAQDLGSDVAQDMAEVTETSVYDQSTGVQFASLTAGSHLVVPPPACVVITPVPVVNSDSDIIPDSVDFDYGNCVFTRAGGVITDSLSGTIDFLDPLPTVPSFGVRHIFTNFRRSRSNNLFPGRSFVAVHNGVREWGASPDTLGHTITNFVTVWTHPSGRTTTHTKDWVARFTATTPGTIGLGLPLPAGTWVLNGTGKWTTLNRTWDIQISTTAPLAYDPSCTEAPRLTSGTLNLVVTRNTEVTNIQVDFTGCGTYAVTRTPGATP